MAIDPRAFNLGQFAEPGVANRPMFQGQLGILPDLQTKGIVDPLRKFLLENSEVAAQPIVPSQFGQLAAKGALIPDMIAPTPGPETSQDPVERFPDLVAPTEVGALPEAEGGISPGAGAANHLAALKRAATAQTEDAVAAGEVTPEVAAAAQVAGRNQYGAVTSDENLDTLQGQLDAVGVGDQYTEDDYNEKAKKILGIEQGEDDVPAWAAPMFLFGLQLMQGPVSSQRERPGPLGGLLGDIGAAGTAAFPAFGAEIARRREDRKDVGTLAYQLKTADTATRTAALDRLWKREQWVYERDLDNQKVISDQLTALTEHYTSGYDPEQKAAFAISLANTITEAGPVAGQTKHANGEFYTNEEVSHWQSRYLLNPVSRQLLGSKAQMEAGLVPDLQIETIPLEAGELSYSPRALRKAAEREGVSTNEMMRRVLASPDDYPTIALSQSVDWSTQSLSMQDVGEGYIQLIHTNLATRAQTPIGAKRLRDAPDIEPWTYTGTDGIEHSVYIDWTALKDKRNRTPGYSLQDAIAEDNTNIIVGEIENFKDYGSRIEDIPIYTEDGRKARAIFDRNKWLEYIRTNPGRELPNKHNPFSQDNLSILQSKGIITLLPGSIEAGEGREFFSMDASGKIVITKGLDAENIGSFTAGLADKATQREIRTQRAAVLNLSRISYEAENLLALAGSAGVELTSKFTDLKAGWASIVRQVRLVLPGKDKTGIKDYKKLLDPSEFGGDRSAAMLAEIERALGDDSFGWIKDGAQRTALRSFLTEAAFALASAREGGKLTDKDVKYAFDTLGWDGDSWSGTPEDLLSGLASASNNQSEAYITKWAASHDPKMVKIAAAGGPGIIEQMLRKEMELRGTGRKFTGIGRRYNEALLRDEETGKLILDDEGMPQLPDDFHLRFDAYRTLLLQAQAAEGGGQEQLAAATEFTTAAVHQNSSGLYNPNAFTTGTLNIAIPNSLNNFDMTPMIATFTTDGGIVVPPVNEDALNRQLAQAGWLKSVNGEYRFLVKDEENQYESFTNIKGLDRERYETYRAFLDWAKKTLWK